MSRKRFHHTFYLLGTMAVAAAVPVSHFLMGLAPFLLLLNWISEWNWREKRIRLRKNRQGLWFVAFYLIYAIGLIRVTDWSAAGVEMLAKLPLLLSPLVIITSKPFKNRELRNIFIVFIAATLFGCCWNFTYARTHILDNIRQMSRFIDHIRFSLCVALSIVFCFHLLLHPLNSKTPLRFIYLIISLLLLSYLLYAQTLSGIIILLVITLCYVIYLIENQKNNKTKWALGGFLVLLLAAATLYTIYITYDYFHVKDAAPDRSALTASGNSYSFEENPMVENGHYIGHYVCKEELQTAWTMRSDTMFDERVSATLIRYLNSLGMRKDSAAVMSLSDQDIRNIEHKTANVYYGHKGNLRRALYETYFGLSLYKKYGIINESSILERIELWRASWQIIREHWFLGVGVGQQRAALDRQLEIQHSPIADKRMNRGSHNQFLTFWMAAGIIPMLYFCFLLVYPFAGLRNRITFVYFALFLLLFLSMLVEDTLSSQAGLMMFAVFVPLLLFNNSRDVS